MQELIDIIEQQQGFGNINFRFVLSDSRGIIDNNGDRNSNNSFEIVGQIQDINRIRGEVTLNSGETIILSSVRELYAD